MRAEARQDWTSLVRIIEICRGDEAEPSLAMDFPSRQTRRADTGMRAGTEAGNMHTRKAAMPVRVCELSPGCEGQYDPAANLPMQPRT
jgi:hypothetical protein